MEVKGVYKTLAFRNMKRQLRNYLIYFVTIAMTISIVFAMNNMIYNKDLQERAESFATLSLGLLVLSSFLCVIIAIVLGYANAFMLRLRKREFGTYLTLGMKRHQIVKLFLLENSLLGFFAIITGFIFGSLIYQGLMLLMSELLEYDFLFSFVSLKGVVITLIMAVTIFVVTFVTSSIYLKRVTIIELIHGEKQVNQVQRKPIVSALITIVSAFAIVYAFYNFSVQLEEVFKGARGSESGLLLMIVLLAVAITSFHIGLAKSLMYGLLKSKKLRGKTTNQFVLRQLSASLNANALLLGILAFLISFAIIATNTGFLYKAVEEANLEKRYPFDVMGNKEEGIEPGISFEEATQVIEQFTPINKVIETPIFTTGEVDFLKLTSWYDEHFTDKDAYMRESDLNALLTALGENPIHLQQQFAIYSNMSAINRYDFSNEAITYNGKSYRLSHVENTIPALVWSYFVIVVPDELIEGMQQVQTTYAIDLASTDIDVTALNEALSYQIQSDNYSIQTSDYRIKDYQYTKTIALSAIFIVGALYIGFVFILLAMAILALKTLSSVSEDEKKYRILYRIGVSSSLQITTLAKEIFIFFAFPVIIPVLLALPITIISEQFIQLVGLEEQLNMTFISFLIIAVLVLVYFIYFFVTFAIMKKHVLD